MSEQIDPNRSYSITQIYQNGWLGVERITIYRMVQKGLLPAFDGSTEGTDQRIRIKGEDIIKFTESRKIK